MAGIRFSHVADRCRQFSVADRKLDRELYLRRRDRRFAPRHLPPSDRSCAELFLRPAAGNAHQPHHRDLERGLHRRKHVRLERTAALHCHDCGNRPDRHGELADGRRPDRDRGRHGDRDVSSGRGGQAAARRFRRQGRGGRRRDGRRHQQHAAGAGVLRLGLRARPVRRDRESGTCRARPQPALSGKTAAHPRCRHGRADHRAARLGDHAVAARRRDHRRCRAGLHAGAFHSQCDARSCGSAGRCHPARGPVDRSYRHAVAAARIARSSASRAAGQERCCDRLQQHRVSLSRRT